MRKGISGELKEVAQEFIKFVHTQESLIEYTEITDTPKAFVYDVSDADLTTYCQSIFNLKNLPTTKVVYPCATTNFYKANQSHLANLMVSNVGDTTVNSEAEAFVSSGYSAKAYFEGMFNYRQTEWNAWVEAGSQL